MSQDKAAPVDPALLAMSMHCHGASSAGRSSLGSSPGILGWNCTLLPVLPGAAECGSAPCWDFGKGRKLERVCARCAVVPLLPVCAMVSCGIASALVHGGAMWVGYSCPRQEQGEDCRAAPAFSSVVPSTREAVHTNGPGLPRVAPSPAR